MVLLLTHGYRLQVAGIGPSLKIESTMAQVGVWWKLVYIVALAFVVADYQFLKNTSCI